MKSPLNSCSSGCFPKVISDNCYLQRSFYYDNVT